MKKLALFIGTLLFLTSCGVPEHHEETPPNPSIVTDFGSGFTLVQDNESTQLQYNGNTIITQSNIPPERPAVGLEDRCEEFGEKYVALLNDPSGIPSDSSAGQFAWISLTDEQKIRCMQAVHRFSIAPTDDPHLFAIKQCFYESCSLWIVDTNTLNIYELDANKIVSVQKFGAYTVILGMDDRTKMGAVYFFDNSFHLIREWREYEELGYNGSIDSIEWDRGSNFTITIGEYSRFTATRVDPIITPAQTIHITLDSAHTSHESTRGTQARFALARDFGSGFTLVQNMETSELRYNNNTVITWNYRDESEWNHAPLYNEDVEMCDLLHTRMMGVDGNKTDDVWNSFTDEEKMSCLRDWYKQSLDISPIGEDMGFFQIDMQPKPLGGVNSIVDTATLRVYDLYPDSSAISAKKFGKYIAINVQNAFGGEILFFDDAFRLIKEWRYDATGTDPDTPFIGHTSSIDSVNWNGDNNFSITTQPTNDRPAQTYLITL